jgi:hypothetical protein
LAKIFFLGKDYKILIQKLQALGDNLTKLNQIIDENGGVDCGWKGDDVRAFCKCKNRHSQNIDGAEFFRDLCENLPLESEEDLRGYIEKYKKYLYLEGKRKEVFAMTKGLKDQKKRLEAQWSRIQEDQKNEKQTKVLEKRREDEIVKKEMVRRWKQQRVIFFLQF